MKEMTKEQIQQRQVAIWDRMDVIEETSKKENREFTDAEAKEYEALIRESKGLSARAEAMASGKALENIREHKSKNAIMREFLQKCVETRSNASTILMNPTEGAGAGETNEIANLEAGGAIPLTINELIDTKVAGVELPADLKVVTGVVGNEIWPYSTNDVEFTVAGEVEKVGEQALNFAKISATPNAVAANVAVSHRAINNAAFDLLGFISYKLTKGLAIFRALHAYSHIDFQNDLKSPFAGADVVEIALDENVGKNIAIEIAKMYDLGFEGVPYVTMSKVTETTLAYTKAIPGTAGDRTVVQDGKCVGYPMTTSPFVNYILDGGVPKAGPDQFLAIGHWGYEAMQIHGPVMFNVDAQSAEVFSRRTVVVSLALDMSMTELSSKVNGKSGKPQAFKLIKLVQPASSNEIGG
jgi:hypothetical protein